MVKEQNLENNGLLERNEENLPEDNTEHGKNVKDCAKCDDIECKCYLIMNKIEDVIELASQIEHRELFNIMLTISIALKHLKYDETCLDKIHDICEEVYSEISPKEMKKVLN